jgi:hypothetical protein
MNDATALALKIPLGSEIVGLAKHEDGQQVNADVVTQTLSHLSKA